ncbi:hypothetical protein M5X11_25040 [Paenibacillus alginolyticus]|uniref:Uncharacterized protein n=1 Tax=Paenibacillus alginolyticus TaxID=59839 RepID=A0ABT4GM55_9BACL|nr:hypothetical protein [Paenibacillus alginolyticus]MCY9668148.1 hypothetical protein [Paenibacillus alginolyticus]MCY9697119.1 hypothetical protein [Paenibacillus alginolyticus]MEC0144707.1 hypothetical protein [Paenibacillus alginolyticus]
MHKMQVSWLRGQTRGVELGYGTAERGDGDSGSWNTRGRARAMVTVWVGTPVVEQGDGVSKS